MSCDEARKLLVALADGEPAGAGADRARRHVASCPACARELEELERDTALLRAEPRPEPPAFLLTRTMARVRARKAATRFGLLPTLATLALLVVAGLALGAVIGRRIVPSAAGPEERLAAVQTGILPMPLGEER